MMDAALETPRVRRAGGRGLAVLVTGILVAGGLSGMVFNKVFAASESTEAEVSVPVTIASASASAPLTSLARSVPVAGDGAGADARPLFRRAESGIVAPPDPFQPSRAPVVKPTAAVEVEASSTAAEPGEEGLQSGLEGPRKSSAPAPPVQAPLPESLAVVGIIQGDPSLAVVRFEGQSFYLKVGDQVADTWRLEEIKERSAVFQLGAQRVEVPIQGGSS